jgi:hypothetical protein
MSKVKYTLTLQCLVDNSAPTEFEWGLTQHVYLTSHFDTEPVVIRVKEGEVPKTVELRGTLPFKARGKIPATAAICFAATAFHRNATGVPCMVEVGTSHVMLSELERPGFTKDIHLTMHTVQDKWEKARLRVALKTKTIDAGLTLAPMQINASTAGANLQQLLQTTYNMEMKMGNTIPGTSNIRCFLDISESGIQLTGTYIPALAFVQGNTPPSNELFWKNALNTVLAREGHDTTWFLNCGDKNEQARIAFLFVDYPVTILPYLGDQIDRRSRHKQNSEKSVLKVGFEQFSHIFALLAGDCEDLARGGNVCARAFQKFMRENPQARTKALTRINEILDQYVITMSLCVVHGAKADDKSTMPKGAHMANFGLPVAYFKKSLERSAEGKQLSQRLPWPKTIETGYETQVLEGTGMLDPRGYRDSKAHVRGYVRQGKWYRGLKHPMIMQHGVESPFFLGALQGWTTYFSDRGASKGIGGFWFTDAKAGTRGSLYVDFTNERSNVALRPMPEAPKEVQRLMVEANTFAMPPEPLVLSAYENNEGNHLLDQLCENVRKLGRPQPPPEKTCTVAVHLSPHQLSKAVAEGLYDDVAGTLKRVWKVAYEREAVTDKYHGYRLVQYVHTD